MTKYPRVLIITTEPFGGNTASSFTLASIFKGWPKDRLAQIYTKTLSPDFSICSRYWRNQSFYFGRHGHFVDPNNISQKLNRSKRDKKCKLTPDMKRLIAFSIDITPCNAMSPAFKKWLQEFNPEVVYSWLGSNRQISLVRQISEYLNISVVPHFMDDWMSSNLPFPIIRDFQALTFRRSLRKLLSHCPEGIGISATMAEEYANRYGIPMGCAANGVASELLQQLRPGAGLRSSDDGEFRIAIFGRLEYGRLELLADFARACQALQMPDLKLILCVYSATLMPEGFPTGKGVETVWQKAPGNDELVLLQKKTDCVLYIDSFGEFQKRYFRLSFSGKIPICLALGRPIITIGPKGMNSVDHLQSCQVGPVVLSRRTSDMTEALKDLFLWDDQRRKTTGMRAWELAGILHSAEIQSEKVRETLVRCAFEGKSKSSDIYDVSDSNGIWPRVSVITVVRNDRVGIQKTINSLSAQDYANLEYIVVDGASTDGTLELIKSHESDIDQFISEPDRGLYDAMNKGKALATGSWALFLNAGDEFASADALRSLLTPRPADDDLVCGNVILSYESRTWRVPWRVNGHPVRSYLPHHQTILYPRSFYEKQDYDISFRIVADSDYTWRALALHKWEDRDVDLALSTLGGFTFTMYSSLKGALRMNSERQRLYRKFTDKVSIVHSIMLALKIVVKHLSVRMGGVPLATALMQWKVKSSRL